MNKQKTHKLFPYFATKLLTVVGIVLIWRGIWYLLDAADARFFGGSRVITAIGGIAIGLMLLFLPDKDLKEIEKI